jgi:hypothetical protein
MGRLLSAPRAAFGLLLAALALAAAHWASLGQAELLAWTLMGITAGYSLSGSV